MEDDTSCEDHRDVNLEELVLMPETEAKQETRKNITKTCEVREGHEIDNDDVCEPVVNLRALSPLGLEFSSDWESFNDSDADPEFHPGVCEAQHCKKNVWSACEDCEMPLCYDHFMEVTMSCMEHGKVKKKNKQKPKGTVKPVTQRATVDISTEYAIYKNEYN
ncbi:hypothetical protein PoB_003533900 [Plakobranchus ocellatus]|uniref:Uncharacterized protein n=1 Tax=Plakobranchus ocellatus TaxID=259542 RepID=A0AAV4ARS9_9GAST|nr:hypothetical protein PoB_003533900 [Plakobranchus ocellatus]